MENKEENALAELEKGITDYVEERIKKIPYGMVESATVISSEEIVENNDKKWWSHKVSIKGIEYTKVKSLGNSRYKDNSVVFIFIPNNQYNNMFILGYLDDVDLDIKGGTININDCFIVNNNGRCEIHSQGFTSYANNSENGDSDNNWRVTLYGNNIIFSAKPIGSSGYYKTGYIGTLVNSRNIAIGTKNQVADLYLSGWDTDGTGYLTHYYCLNNIQTPWLSHTERHIFRDNVGFINNVNIDGNLSCYGTKNRIVVTKDYGDRKLNAIESPEAYFSDYGSSVCEEDGTVRVDFEEIFKQTISLNKGYNVQLTQTSEDSGWVEKKEDYFIIHSVKGATFDWVVTCKQKGYEDIRLEPMGEE